MRQKMPIKIPMVINFFFFLNAKARHVFPFFICTRLLIHDLIAPHSIDFGKKPIVFLAPQSLFVSRLRRIQSIEQVAQFEIVMHVITNKHMQRTRISWSSCVAGANSRNSCMGNRVNHQQPAANSRHWQMNLIITFKFEELVLHFVSASILSIVVFAFACLVAFANFSLCLHSPSMEHRIRANRNKLMVNWIAGAVARCLFAVQICNRSVFHAHALVHTAAFVLNPFNKHAIQHTRTHQRNWIIFRYFR